jgi:hemerythrin superfamily protein
LARPGRVFVGAGAGRADTEQAKEQAEESAMGDATEDMEKAAKLPEGDLVRILYTQHALAKDLMDQVESASGEERQELFTQLATTLKAHETAEEAVVRPVTTEAGAGDVAEARNDEETEADEIILALKELDVDSAEFDSQFAAFKQAVSDHAESEETEEFPVLQSKRSDEDRQMLGKEFLAQFEAAGGKA